MPPGAWSRHLFTTEVRDSQGRRWLTDRERYEYRDLPDNIHHPVAEGDTWWSIAWRYYRGLEERIPHFSAAEMFWVVCDFQVPVVRDPTIVPAPGTIVVLPSRRTVREEIFSPARRRT